MARSIWKGPFVHPSLLKKIDKLKDKGNSKPIKLMDYIAELEHALGKVAKKNFVEMQAGDVQVTASDTQLLYNLTGFRPKISIKEGVLEFVDWYKSYYSGNKNNCLKTSELQIENYIKMINK